MGPFQWQMSWPRHVPATWSPFFGAPSSSLPSSSFSALEEERERKTPEKRRGPLRAVRAARARRVLRRAASFLPSFLSARVSSFFFLSRARRDAPAALVIQRISHRHNDKSVASRPICAKIWDPARTFADPKTPSFNACYESRSED